MGFKDIPILLKFEEELSLPKYFLSNLVREDDWSFVIKLSSVFEAVCTQLLVTSLNAKVLSDAFSHLELGSRKYGKLAMLEALGLIDKECRLFIGSLATLRNDFVHDISKTTSTIREHINVISDKNQLVKNFGYKIDKVKIRGEEIASMDFFMDKPKIAIWIGAVKYLSKMISKKQEMHLDNLFDAVVLERHSQSS